MTRRVGLVVALVALALALPPLAGAQTQRAHQEPPAPTTARLQAEGSGVVRLEGRMVVFGLLARDSTIWFRDLDGDARIFVDGREPDLRDGRATRLNERSGRFYVSGSDVMLQLRGDRISLSAAGRGEAWVLGDGGFRLNDGSVRDWFGGEWRPPSFAVVPDRLAAARARTLEQDDRERR